MATIRYEKISKYFGTTKVLEDFSLDIMDGEFIVLVGPSGCGKTTLLRLLAGLEEISGGNLYIDDRRVNEVAPKDRDIAMVFQNYALYPHMTVYDNLTFGLKLRKVPKQEIESRVQAATELLGISDFLERKPKQLSGGQRQRVALGRAIIRNPKIFVFDEPLSNLDAKLRVQMRSEIKKLHARLNTTMLYVTHDQVEAMTMGDRVVILEDGAIQQIGTPSEVYHSPANLFVAGFIGSPPMNLIEGQWDGQFFTAGKLKLRLPDLGHHQPGPLIMGVRPENVIIGRAENAAVELPLSHKEMLGAELLLYFKLDGHDLISRASSDLQYEVNKTLPIAFEPSALHFYDVKTGLAI